MPVQNLQKSARLRYSICVQMFVDKSHKNISRLHFTTQSRDKYLIYLIYIYFVHITDSMITRGKICLTFMKILVLEIVTFFNAKYIFSDFGYYYFLFLLFIYLFKNVNVT